MYWVRSHLRLGSFLALSALVFQLAVCFGHVHLHASPLSDSGPVVAAAAQTGAALSSEPASHEVPAATDHCAFCALIDLASSLLAVKLPMLPLAGLSGNPPAPITAEFGLIAAISAPFAARAPPIA